MVVFFMGTNLPQGCVAARRRSETKVRFVALTTIKFLHVSLIFLRMLSTNHFIIYQVLSQHHAIFVQRRSSSMNLLFMVSSRIEDLSGGAVADRIQHSVNSDDCSVSWSRRF